MSDLRRLDAELQIGRLEGAQEGGTVRISVSCRAAGVAVVIEVPLIDYAQATFGRLVTTAELSIHIKERP